MLARPANRHVITKIKAAITAGIRPMSMIFHQQPTAEWQPFDFKLLEAYQILQDETCPKCGHPVWLCRSNSNTVAFKVRTAVCAADRALQEYEDGKKDRKSKASRKERAEWGQYHYTEPFVPDVFKGVSLPDREDYYKELAEMSKQNGAVQ